MGGGPARELLLCVLPFPEPKSILEHLRRTFPDTDIVYIPVGLDAKSSSTKVPAELWRTATVLCTLYTFPQHVADVPNLRLVHLVSAGSNQMTSQPLYTGSDVTITTSSGIHGPQIAEWVLMTRLVASHKYNLLHALQRQHRWGGHSVDGRPVDYRNVRDQVRGRIGILGYGSIGRQVGRVAHALGMRVVAYTASPKDSPAARRDHGFIVPGTGDADGSIPVEWYSGTDPASLRAFLAKDLDWLVVAVPLTDATRHLLGREEFAALSADGTREVFVSNIARGPIIRQAELITALKDGTLAGAALDVTDPEPLPADSELWGLENVIVTPHVAGVGSEYVDRTFQVLEENLKRLAKGERPFNVVRRERGY